MEVKVFDDASKALVAAGEELNNVLKSSPSILLLLSGGSALGLLGKINTEILGRHVTVSVLDERYSKSPSVNNFAQIAATDFYKKAKNAGCVFIDTRVNNGETKEELADRFGSGLGQWFDSNPDGKVIATVGIGGDGHASGMMPYPEDKEEFARLFEKDRLVVAYNAGDKNEYPDRITTTMTLMRKINSAIVYSVGESKRKPLRRVLAKGGYLNETPSRIVRDIADAKIFTDVRM